jgi:hypothetical protein
MIPSFEADCKEFIYGSFDHISCDLFRDEIVTNLLPKHLEILRKEGQQYNNSNELHLLEGYANKPPSVATVLRWMHDLGFKRDSAKKSYYVDGHEKPEQAKKHFTYKIVPS